VEGIADPAMAEIAKGETDMGKILPPGQNIKGLEDID
jgi:hypothetical protein